MKYKIILILLIALGLNGHINSQNIKRGIAYGSYLPADVLQTMKNNISWWYNWGTKPQVEFNNGVIYVPMIWSAIDTNSLPTIIANIPDEAKYILGYNEPNFKSQASLTPQEAAANWHLVEAIAEAKQLQIIGPALNFSGDPVAPKYKDPFVWLDEFFAALDSAQISKIDYIGLHHYGSGLQGVVDNYIAKYNKPVWVTEFAYIQFTGTSEKHSVGEQKKYMAQTFYYLESNEMVFRYAWFAEGGKFAALNISLFASLNGKIGLSELGEYFIRLPHNGNDNFPPYSKPWADKTYATSTITLHDDFSGDVDGNIVKYEWSKISGPNAVIQNANIKSTNVTGLQNGLYVFSLKVTDNDGASDSTSVSFQVTGLTALQNSNISDISYYPNPASSVVKIRGINGTSEIKVFNIVGNEVYKTSANTGTCSIDISDWNKGIYVFELKNKKQTYSGKIVRN